MKKIHELFGVDFNLIEPTIKSIHSLVEEEKSKDSSLREAVKKIDENDNRLVQLYFIGMFYRDCYIEDLRDISNDFKISKNDFEEVLEYFKREVSKYTEIIDFLNAIFTDEDIYMSPKKYELLTILLGISTQIPNIGIYKRPEIGLSDFVKFDYYNKSILDKLKSTLSENHEKIIQVSVNELSRITGTLPIQYSIIKHCSEYENILDSVEAVIKVTNVAVSLIRKFPIEIKNEFKDVFKLAFKLQIKPLRIIELLENYRYLQELIVSNNYDAFDATSQIILNEKYSNIEKLYLVHLISIKMDYSKRHE